MPLTINSTISALDKPSSLAPFFVKDSFDITGRTAMAYHESGKHEAREKFIEEAGTSMFWIGGIPFARWIGGKIANKFSGINSNIHFKRINSEGIQSYFADEVKQNDNKKFSSDSLKNINLCGSNANSKLNKIKTELKEKGFMVNGSKGGYKKFHVGVTAASVLVNLFILCVGIPKLNQFISRKIIAKEHKNQQTKTNLQAQPTQDSVKISEKTAPQKQKQVRFGSLKDLANVKSLFNFTEMAENAQLNVTSSMLLLDYGISGSRVTFVPRDNNERIEYFVKEGGIIFFFYYAADLIKKGLSALANKSFKTPIDLDYKIINDKDFAKTLNENKNTSELLKFAAYENIDDAIATLPNEIKSDKKKLQQYKDELSNKNEISVIKFIDEELANVGGKVTDKTKTFSNFTLQMAQKSGLIDVEYDEALGKWIRHSEKYIETDKVADLNGNLKNFIEQAAKSGETKLEKIISKTKMTKGLSVFGNMAICCASLSFILPKIQYKIREHRTKTKMAPGIKLYEELAEKNQLKVY